MSQILNRGQFQETGVERKIPPTLANGATLDCLISSRMNFFCVFNFFFLQFIQELLGSSLLIAISVHVVLIVAVAVHVVLIVVVAVVAVVVVVIAVVNVVVPFSFIEALHLRQL